MKKVLISALAFMAIGTNIYAVCSTGTCADVDVEKIVVTTTGDILVATSGTETNLNCTTVVNQYVTIPENNPGKNALYSMFLTAKTTKNKVSISIIPGTTGCKVSYAYMY